MLNSRWIIGPAQTIIKGETVSINTQVNDVLTAVRKRKVQDPKAFDTFRCARLANADRAIEDLRHVGHSVVPTTHKFALSPRMSELVQLIHHVDVKVFRGDPRARKDRYSSGFIALYSGESQTTAEKEIRHYVVTRFAIDNPKQEVFELSVFSIEFHGAWRDLSGLEERFPALIGEKKDVPQGVGKSLSEETGLSGLKVPSARHFERKSGKRFSNWVSFDREALTPLEVLGTLKYTIPYDKRGRRRAAQRSFEPR